METTAPRVNLSLPSSLTWIGRLSRPLSLAGWREHYPCFKGAILMIQCEEKMSMEKLLTLEEIAKNLHMEVDSARKLVKREKLGMRIGKRVFVQESDWKKFIERKKKENK